MLVRKMMAVAAVAVLLAAGLLAVTGCENAADGGDSSSDGDASSSVWKVIPTKNIVMCDHEVTQAEWNDVMGDLDTKVRTDTQGKGNNYPMYYVSWYDALVYCNKLSMKENLTPCYSINGKTNPAEWGDVPTEIDDTWNAVTCNFNANGYRLPKEEEWEYAAKGGENHKYSGSDNIDDVAWYSGNSSNKTHEVKGKSPNEYGMYDMSGNVWEWCWELYNSSDSYRVVRGGGWNDNANLCAVSHRSNSSPRSKMYDRGFRVVRGQ